MMSIAIWMETQNGGDSLSELFAKIGNIKPNHRNKINGMNILKDMNDEVIATVFFDPQYRGVLDKLKYGNEGKERGRKRSQLPQMTEQDIQEFIREISRVMKPSGYLFLWVDKFHLCQGVADWLFDKKLKVVDMIVWDKGKIGMGYRTRRKSEYLVVFQKEPILAKATWKDHSIPDVWQEKIKKVHPHSKPIELQKRLIAATTDVGDYVLDPAAGGFSVYEACKLLDRDFIGGDIVFGDE